MSYNKLKNMIKRKDGSYSKKGLWDNIRAKDDKTSSNAKKGSDDYPEKKAFKKAQGK